MQTISHATAHPASGHGGHHQPGSVFPGQPPAHVLPTPVGPGTTQPHDLPDTAKGSPLPHWDGVLLGVTMRTVQPPIDPFSKRVTPPAATVVRNVYVNGAFNYGDFASVDQALTAVRELTAGAERPAAVVWKDKFGIVHAQALLTWGSSSSGSRISHADLLLKGDDGTHVGGLAAGPRALHLDASDTVVLGHPEALYVVDGDVVVSTSVPHTVPVPANGGTGWSPGGAP